MHANIHPESLKMKGERSISVIIPVYNAEKYLGEAIESVQQQKIQPAEVFVVDDGSTDNSAEVAKTFMPEITLIQQLNRGISAARNTAVKRARGSMLAFLDADDIWTDDHLEKLTSELHQNSKLDMVAGHVEQFLSDDAKERSHQTIDENQKVLPGYVAGASLIKKEVFEAIGLFDEGLTLAEFVDWFSRAKDSGFSFKMIPDVVLRRRIHTQNQGIRKKEHINDYTKVLFASIRRKRNRG